ncbi:MAG TPA: hypothetical protein VNM70_11020 [Burkholderiales bacterium]|nr:hypothetical protein [Burkholderiales bacterium]
MSVLEAAASAGLLSAALAEKPSAPANANMARNASSAELRMRMAFNSLIYFGDELFLRFYQTFIVTYNLDYA